MVGLIKKRRTKCLRASTLVETLVAMTILLTVFGIGMLLFANLTRSADRERNARIRMQMGHVLWQVSMGRALGGPISVDGVKYYVEEEHHPGLPGCRRATVFAELMENGTLVDSLSAYHESVPDDGFQTP